MIQSPCRRAMASVSTISSRVATKPVGLAGALKKIRRVRGVTAFSSLAGSRLQRVPLSSGTGTARRPRNLEGADEIGPGGRWDQRFVARADNEPGRDLDRVHAADRHKEIRG